MPAARANGKKHYSQLDLTELPAAADHRPKDMDTSRSCNSSMAIWTRARASGEDAAAGAGAVRLSKVPRSPPHLAAAPKQGQASISGLLQTAQRDLDLAGKQSLGQGGGPPVTPGPLPTAGIGRACACADAACACAAAAASLAAVGSAAVLLHHAAALSSINRL